MNIQAAQRIVKLFSSRLCGQTAYPSMRFPYQTEYRFKAASCISAHILADALNSVGYHAHVRTDAYNKEFVSALWWVDDNPPHRKGQIA